VGNAPYEILEKDDRREAGRTRPVFLDTSGRRRRWLRVAGFGVAGACGMYTAVVAVSLMGGPVSPDSVLPLPEHGTAAKRADPAPTRSAPTAPGTAPTRGLRRPRPTASPAPGTVGKRTIPAPATVVPSQAPSSPRSTPPTPAPSTTTRTPDPDERRAPSRRGGGLLGLLGLG